MSNKISIKLLADRVEERLQQMKLEGADQTSALDAMGRWIANRVRLGFRAGRDPWGKPWAPLNPGFRQGSPLRDTGRLQQSINHQVQGNSVAVGTNVHYARTHQYGASIKPVNGKLLAFPGANGMVFAKGVKIPARPFLPMIGDTIALPPKWAEGTLKALAKAMGVSDEE